MLLSEQQLHLVHETADRIYVVDRGRSSTRTRRSPAATSWSPADDRSDRPKLRVAASLESLGVFASVPAALTRREQLESSRGSWIRYKGGRAVPPPSVPLGPVGVRRRKQANRHTATLPNPGSFLRRTGLDPFQGTVEGCRRGGFRAADRLRTRLPGVFQEPGPHDRRTVGRRGQTYSMPGRQDGVSPRTKPAGGDHDQDRCFTVRRRRAPSHPGGNGRIPGPVCVQSSGQDQGFSRARIPGSAGFQPAMGRRRTMVHAGKIPVLPGRRRPQPEFCA